MIGTSFDVEVIAASGGGTLTFTHNTVIHRRDDAGDRAYIVKSGRVELRQKGRAVETIGPGEIFGEASLVDGIPRLEAAVAIDTVELIPIDRRMFAILVRDDGDFALTVVGSLVRRLRATTEMFERCVDDLPLHAPMAAASPASP